MSAEDIKNKKWTKTQRAGWERLVALKDSEIDYSDIPELTDEQLASMVRLREFRAKVPVSVRLDPRCWIG